MRSTGFDPSSRVFRPSNPDCLPSWIRNVPSRQFKLSFQMNPGETERSSPEQ